MIPEEPSLRYPPPCISAFTGQRMNVILFPGDSECQEQQEQKEEQKRTKKKKRTENEENERRKTHETRFENVTNTRKKEALQLLEITENADEQEIKSAYRRLVKMYHPDTLPANTSEEEKEEATERFRSIHEAYEFLLEQVVLMKNKSL